MTTHPPDAPGPRPPLAATFFVAFLLVQLAVPAYMLTQPRPARFGWQMYSAVRPDVVGGAFHIEDARGEASPVVRSLHVARARLEVDYLEVLPPYLCEVVAGAAAVVYRRGDTVTHRYPCP
jgi:hypothetical protein